MMKNYKINTALLLAVILLFSCNISGNQKSKNKEEKKVKKPIVVLFIIDGLMPDAAETAINNGATNLKFFNENGVVVNEAYCLSPSRSAILPDGSKPWGGATPPNLGMHKGTHVFEIPEIDDIFLSARRKGIKSMFAGGHDLYKVFTTPDFTYAKTGYSDSTVVQYAIDHLKNSDVQLYRLHLQQIRYSWSGPEGKTDPNSKYQKAILNADKQLGRLVHELKENDLWDNCFFIVTSDHGMGQTKKSRHFATDLSSWKIYMNFFGPGIKRGEQISYAESPDVAIMTNYLLKCSDLQGYKKSVDSLKISKTTGVLLSNIFEGKVNQINHPMWIKKYLESNNWKPELSYLHYRQAMLNYINQ